MSMIAYILNTNDEAAMIATLAGISMTYIDDNEIEKWSAPNQCRFFSISAITQHKVTDDSDPENSIITTPRLIKSGFWLLLYANAPIVSIEALDELKYCCDTQMGEFTAHCASVTTTAITGAPVINFDGLPSGVSGDCFNNNA